MTHRTAHHLEVGPECFEGNGGLGRYVFLPGSSGRARRLAARFEDPVRHDNRRGHDVHLGHLVRGDLRVDVATVPTGMGCPSVDIIVTELIHLGARRFLRVGTAGGLVEPITAGDLVIATGAVRDEAASDAYAPREVPALADPLLTECLTRAACRLGLGDHVFRGPVHSKDSFFGREFGEGPAGEANLAYMHHLARLGVVASEMEAAHLFVLCSALADGVVSTAADLRGAAPLRAGALLAIIGGLEGFASRAKEEETEERMLDLAVEAILDLAAIETGAPSVDRS